MNTSRVRDNPSIVEGSMVRELPIQRISLSNLSANQPYSPQSDRKDKVMVYKRRIISPKQSPEGKKLNILLGGLGKIEENGLDTFRGGERYQSVLPFQIEEPPLLNVQPVLLESQPLPISTLRPVVDNRTNSSYYLVDRGNIVRSPPHYHFNKNLEPQFAAYK